MKYLLRLAVAALFTVLLVASAIEASQVQHRPKRIKVVTSAKTDVELTGKTVQYGTKDVIRLSTKVRFTTLIILPATESILDFSCGDKEFWVVNGNSNIAYVKPAKEGATTNLNLVTASGNIYTFLLVEVSRIPEAEPDLKVFIQPRDQSLISTPDQPSRFVSSAEVSAYRQQIEAQKEELLRTRQEGQDAMDARIGKFLSETKFTYHFTHDKPPFYVQAIYHDQKFTYIKAKPDETPTLYEVREGKPNLVNFDYHDGVFVVEKIIDHGYLAIGKSRLVFVRKEAQ